MPRDEKADLKLNIQKTKITSGPINSWQTGDKKWKLHLTLFRGEATKSLWKVTVAMKLKDSCSLKEKI